MARIIQSVEPKPFRSCLVEGRWDENLKLLKKQGYPFPSTVRDLFYAQIHTEDPEDPINSLGGYVKPFVIYPNGKDAKEFFLISYGEDNPLLRNPKNVTDTHADGKEVSITQRSFDYFLKKARDDPKKAVETGVLLVRRDKLVGAISQKEFDKYFVSQFLAQDQARPYATLYLKRNKVKEVPLYFTNSEYVAEQQKPFVSPLWVRRLAGVSGLRGYSHNLLYSVNSRVFGVQVLPAEQAEKNLERKL